MTVKPAVKIKNETYGIYGYCDYATQEQTQSNSGRTGMARQANIKRLILKTDNDKANDLTVNIRRSLLKRCQNVQIRTDIQAEGIYFVKTWLLNLIPQFEAELSHQGDSASQDDAFEFASFSDDFLPFIAKNQFKRQIRRNAPVPKPDSF